MRKVTEIIFPVECEERSEGLLSCNTSEMGFQTCYKYTKILKLDRILSDEAELFCCIVSLHKIASDVQFLAFTNFLQGKFFKISTLENIWNGMSRL